MKIFFNVRLSASFGRRNRPTVVEPPSEASKPSWSAGAAGVALKVQLFQVAVVALVRVLEHYSGPLLEHARQFMS